MKRLLSMAVAVAMVTSLCACGGGSATTATTATGNSGTTESGAAAATDGKNYDNVTLKLSYATDDTGMDGLYSNRV